uniref:Uncharacterized protein n=1 Tax=Romanomermis culicivorax TaxID=13658 RepID=A0A915JC36_ROMCU
MCLQTNLNLTIEGKFREASLEWVNYLHFHKNIVPKDKEKKDNTGTNLIDMFGSVDEYILHHISRLYILQLQSDFSLAKCPLKTITTEITGYAMLKEKRMENSTNKQLHKVKKICGQMQENGSSKCQGIPSFVDYRLS